MSWRTLAVLMWKHGVVRKRRFFHTPVEFLAPIFFFIILFSFKDKIHSRPTHAVGEFIDIERPESILLDRTMVPPVVLYTPDTPLTKTLMGIVGAKLQLQPLQSLASNGLKGYIPFNNASDIFEYSKQMGPNDAIVIFQTMLHYHINETMNYSKLFQDMEQIKSSSSGLVEDFSVSETTLEEVFISFSRIQEEDIAEQKKSQSRKKAEEKNKNKTEGISETKPGGKIVKKTGFKSEDQIVEKRDSKTDKKTGEKSGDKTEDKRDKATGGEDGSKPKDGNTPGSSKKSGPGPRK